MKIPGQEIPLADFKQQPLPSPKIFFKKKKTVSFGKLLALSTTLTHKFKLFIESYFAIVHVFIKDMLPLSSKLFID